MPAAPLATRAPTAGQRDAHGERGASRVEVGGLEIDRMAAARLEHELEHRRGVQVVELDGLPDPPPHQDLRAPLPPVVLPRLAVLRRVLHAGDVLDALAVRVEELLVDTRPADRLDELEAEPVDRGLGADHPVLDLLAADDGVVQQRWLVVEHAPRAPAEVLGVRTQRGLDVGNDDSNLRDRHGDRRRHDAAAGTAYHRYLPRACTVIAAARDRSMRRKRWRWQGLAADSARCGNAPTWAAVSPGAGPRGTGVPARAGGARPARW